MPKPKPKPEPKPEPDPATSTALQQGNAALRAGQYAQAIRHYALGLLAADEAASAHNPLTDQFAHNLLLARKRYRRQRQAGIDVGGKLQVVVSGWSLSENPAGRAYTLASLYQDLAERPDVPDNGKRPGSSPSEPPPAPGIEPAPGIAQVSLIGSLFANRGRQLWAPLRELAEQGPIPIHSILIDDERRFMAQAIDLVSAHPADLLHCCKPRWPNILFALLYQQLWDARVLVDIDDDELAFVQGTPLPDLATQGAEPLIEAWLRRYDGLPAWNNLPARPWTELGMSLCHAFDGLSVANRAFQQRHGGTIIRHARDPRQFQPSAERRRRARARLGLRPAQRVVLFLGTPRWHKGLLETAQALASLQQPELVYLIVGGFPPNEQPIKQALQAIRGLDLRLLDDQPFARIPELLAAADLAVFLQDPSSAAARAQTPAKLSDALAMGLTVLAEPTPGLADLQEQGAFIPVRRADLAPALRQALSTLPAERDAAAHAPEPHPVFARELGLAVNRARLGEALAGALVRDRAHPARAADLEHLASLPLLGPLPRALVSAGIKHSHSRPAPPAGVTH